MYNASQAISQDITFLASRRQSAATERETELQDAQSETYNKSRQQNLQASFSIHRGIWQLMNQ
jgi:hypothetical protein